MPNGGMTYEEALELDGQIVSVKILDEIEPIVREKSKKHGLTHDKTGFFAPVNRLPLEETCEVCSDKAVVEQLTYRIPQYGMPPEIHVWKAVIEGSIISRREFKVELNHKGKEFVRECIVKYVSKKKWNERGLSHLLWLLNPYLRGEISHTSVYDMHEPDIGNIIGELMICEICERGNIPPPSDYVVSCRKLRLPPDYLKVVYSPSKGNYNLGIYNSDRIKEEMEKIVITGAHKVSDLLETDSK